MTVVPGASAAHLMAQRLGGSTGAARVVDWSGWLRSVPEDARPWPAGLLAALLDATLPERDARRATVQERLGDVSAAARLLAAAVGADSGAPLALYGGSPRLAHAVVRAASEEVAVFLPGPGLDLKAWRMVDDHLAVRRVPGAGPRAEVVEGWPEAGFTAPLVVAPDRERRAEAVRVLASRGWLDDMPTRRAVERWRAALAAAIEPVDLEAVVAWLGAEGCDADTRRAVVRAGYRVAEWPEGVRAARERLVDARQRLEQATNWQAVGEGLKRFAVAAGVPSPFPASGWDVLDAYAVPVSTAAVLEAPLVEDDGGAPPTTVMTLDEWAGIPVDEVVGFGPPDTWPLAALRRLLAAASRVYRVDRLAVPSRRSPGTGPSSAGRFPPGTVRVPETVTAFERYGTCPLRYAWEALGVEPVNGAGPEPDAAMAGRWIHRALEKMAVVADGDAYAAAERSLRQAIRELPPPPTVVEEVLDGWITATAQDLAWVWWRHPPGDEVRTEVPFTIENVAAEVPALRGRIDRLERQGAMWLAVDYKSGEVPPAVVGPKSLQLACYARGAQVLLGLKEGAVDAAYWSVSRRTGFGEHRLAGDFAGNWKKACDVLAAIARRVAQGACLPYPAPGACRTCPYRVACPATVEQDAAALRARDAEFCALWTEGDGDADAGMAG